MTKNIIKFFLVFVLILQAFVSFSQEEEKKPVDKPVRSPWEATTLVDFPTTKNLAKGSFEIMIHHRFGEFGNGFTDLIGIYAPSNIRLGVDYGITETISVGFGTEKNNKMQEFRAKWNVLRQTRSGRIPVDITLFGNMVVDGRNKDGFGVNFEGKHRLSYFTEAIVSRKFTDGISAYAGVSFSHFNSVDSLSEHDKIALHFGGRARIWSTNSFIIEYTQPLDIKSIQEHIELTNAPKAGLSMGMEFGTSTHAFQVFISNYQQIIPQKNVAFNQNDFFEFRKNVLLGFNITVRL